MLYESTTVWCINVRMMVALCTSVYTCSSDVCIWYSCALTRVHWIERAPALSAFFCFTLKKHPAQYNWYWRTLAMIALTPPLPGFMYFGHTNSTTFGFYHKSSVYKLYVTCHCLSLSIKAYWWQYIKRYLVAPWHLMLQCYWKSPLQIPLLFWHKSAAL